MKGTNTIFFISKDKVPKDRAKEVTYGSFRCNLKSNKTKTHCTRLTTGGDRVNYPGDAGTPCMPMKRFEYMRLKITDIPDKIIRESGLQVLATSDGYVYCEIQKGMYSLPQAGIIAQELLKE